MLTPWIQFGKPLHLSMDALMASESRGTSQGFFDACKPTLELIPGMELLMMSGERHLVGTINTSSGGSDEFGFGPSDIIAYYRTLVPWPTNDLPNEVEF